MENVTAYPLAWPFGWKRTKFPHTSAFTRKGFGTSRDFLLDEIERLGAKNVILSTNIELRLDGIPYANKREPSEKGVAVYFFLNKKDVVLACDKWDKIEHNLWAIAKHIESIRGQGRWGVGTVEQAFQGYTALPENTSHKDYFAGISDYKSHFKTLAKEMHPDKGGDAKEFSEMNRQYRSLQNRS